MRNGAQEAAFQMLWETALRRWGGSLLGYSQWSCQELDTTERLAHTHCVCEDARVWAHWNLAVIGTWLSRPVSCTTEQLAHTRCVCEDARVWAHWNLPVIGTWLSRPVSCFSLPRIPSGRTVGSGSHCRGWGLGSWQPVCLHHLSPSCLPSGLVVVSWWLQHPLFTDLAATFFHSHHELVKKAFAIV